MRKFFSSLLEMYFHSVVPLISNPYLPLVSLSAHFHPASTPTNPALRVGFVCGMTTRNAFVMMRPPSRRRPALSKSPFCTQSYSAPSQCSPLPLHASDITNLSNCMHLPVAEHHATVASISLLEIRGGQSVNNFC